MLWEELTSDEFAKAVVDCGRTCVLPLGVLERHGPHLPLGTDMLIAHHVAAQAAEREPAVVFPQWFFGKIFTARCFPGTITLPPKMLVELLLELFDEIGRNGFTKIVAYNGHGGNRDLLKYLLRSQLAEEKPYKIYTLFYDEGLNDEARERLEQVWESPVGEHADERESSLMMTFRPDLVKMDALGGRVAEPLARLDHIKPGQTSFDWYANYPEHYAGDARSASVEKGNAFSEAMIDGLARFISTVKNDTVVAELADEFFRREREIRGGK
jgi:creatinine amidohydrolase